MRLTGGSARGKVLLTPRGQTTRPTDARTREMLFNILAGEIADARVLDLYAGSGAVGLEALSRGATSCTFVEQSKPAAALIRSNLEQCGWKDSGEIWPCPVAVALRKLSMQKCAFDIIFADPPFHAADEWIHFAATIDKAAALLDNVTEAASSGLLVVQHPQRQLLQVPASAELLETRRAGESNLSFFQKNITP